MPHPGRALRHRRLQADRASRSDPGRVPALGLARFDRPAGAHGRLLRRARRRAFRRADRRAARVPLQGLRMAVPQTLVLDNVEPPVAAAFEQAVVGAAPGRRPRRRYCAARACRAAGAQRQGRPGDGRGLRRSSRLDRPSRAAIRPARAGAHPARPQAGCRRLHRAGQCPRRFHRSRRRCHRALRRAGAADGSADRPAHRRSRGGRCLPPRQCAAPAQSRDREFSRPLLDLDSVSSPGRGAGRPDADRRAWRRSAAARHRCRGRTGGIAVCFVNPRDGADSASAMRYRRNAGAWPGHSRPAFRYAPCGLQ